MRLRGDVSRHGEFPVKEKQENTMAGRREFLKLALAGTASMCLLPKLGEGICSASPVRDRPNVLLIVFDDLRDYVACINDHPGVKTPNMDRLAQRGVVFTNAHVTAPLCNPSRVSFLTGVRPSTSGIYGNATRLRDVWPDAVTLPQHFMANGYYTAGGGKVLHFADPDSWNEYFDQTQPMDMPAPSERLNTMLGQGGGFDWGPLDITDEETHDMNVVSWAAQALRRTFDRPFFLAVGITRPHVPMYAPKKYFNLYPPSRIIMPPYNANDLDDVPLLGKRTVQESIFKNVLQCNQWQNAVRGYLACVSFGDALVGKVLDALDNSAYCDNTIVVLCSDHGWHLGEKSHFQKCTLWEESTRIPLIIAGPGVSTRRLSCAKAVSNLDLYPTLIEMCGLSQKDGLEVTSLTPLLRNPQSTLDRPPAVTTFFYKSHAVRDDRYRYICYTDGTEELYDHEGDRYEWNNLAGKSEYASVKAGLAAWLPKQNAPGPSVGNDLTLSTPE
jgi:arylsulfatase A-like enzyme